MPDIESALRDLVRLRAAGLCEYCRISERFTLAEHEIDHVIAVKHGGQTVEENLALCCTVCNKFKGSDIPKPANSRLCSIHGVIAGMTTFSFAMAKSSP